MDALVQAILDWLDKHSAQEQAVVTSAPIAFLVCLSIASVGMFFILRAYFRQQLSAKDGTIQIHEERHKLKDEKITNFLLKTEDSASPEVLAQIAALRAELKQGQWRTITPDQRRKFCDALSGAAPQIWELYWVGTDMESKNFAQQIIRLLRDAGMTQGYMTSGDREQPDLDRLGFTMHIKNVAQPPEDANRLLRAFAAADIDCKLTSARVVTTAQDHFLALRIGLKPE